VCSLIENKEKIIGCKWDTLTKQQGRRIVVKDMPKLGVKKGGEYITHGYAHMKKCNCMFKGVLSLILAQVKKFASEGNQKIVQMKFILHVLYHGHLMLKYESLYELFRSLAVPNNPSMHWYDIVGWVLAKFMYMQVQDTIVKAIQSTRFIACSCDEVTTIDNGSWICVHAYMVDSWIKVPILFCVERIVDGLALIISLKSSWLH
jgi:hypothetical protein